MIRLIPVALLFLLAVPAEAQTVSSAETWRFRDVQFADNTSMQLPGTSVGSQGRLSLGMFGLKAAPAPSRQKAVTVREIDAPRHRRAGVGFSLKF